MIAYFTFHGTLNYFLPRAQKNKTIAYPFDWKATVKDMFESLGPPHPEAELIVVNGSLSVDLEYIVQDQDRFDIYDQGDAYAITPKVRLYPPYPQRPQFILDTHLGRTAAYLRMMGFDTLYRNDYDDEELARISDVETRILLTRDIGLLKRGRVMYGYFVRNTTPRLSLKEISDRYQLAQHAQPFRYCMKCNGQLLEVPKEAILDRIQPGTADYYDAFHQCQACQQVYWKGSHYERMAQLLQEVLEA
jgi:hypothetical protein